MKCKDRIPQDYPLRLFLVEYCEQPRKVAGVKARKIAEGERLRMIKSSG